jgi:hypothetical protein
VPNFWTAIRAPEPPVVAGAPAGAAADAVT